MTKLACFITSHGFGHASRSCAVLEKTLRKIPELSLEIFTDVPHWFLKENLPKGSFEHHRGNVDVGLVQQDPFTHDLSQTVRRLETFLAFREKNLSPIVEKLQKTRCSTVLCDISPLGIVAAMKADIPSILLENFTWDWIYEEYLEDFPQLEGSIGKLKEIYDFADLRIQTIPICNPVSQGIKIKPIARSLAATREETRERLKTAPKTPLVHLTTGGIQGEYQFRERLRSRPDVRFITTCDQQDPNEDGNLIELPHRSIYHYPDLVAASDAVVGKAGYGTANEVLAAGIPFARVLRRNFRESKVLKAFMDQHLYGFDLTEKEFESLSWIERLEELLSFPRNESRELDGAEQASELITSKICS